MNRLLTLSLLALVFLSACTLTTSEVKEAAVETKPALNLDSIKAAIAASNAAFGECFAKNDSVNFVARYTSDACINPTGMPQICGSAGIGAYFRGGYDMGIRNIKLSTKNVMLGDAYAIETGAYELQLEGGKAIESGKFIVIWKQENGAWKMYQDIWNSDAPAK